MVINKVDYSDFFFIRFQNGDEPAFEKIFNSNYPQLAGFCNQFLNDLDRAQSLAQEAFIHLWLNREKIETLNGIRSFLYTYAKSSCLNDLRHRKVVSKYQDKHLQAKEEQLNIEVLESFDFHSLELSELEALIKQSIDELPEKCRLVFLMSRMEGKKNKEIAEELDISVKSVEANITRALKTLKTNLSEYLPVILVQILLQHFS
ncbi:RNA polymerase sigma-70 factor [Prolixibacter sp. SD074]|uniref:RNA polymerase sigma-70 factor n=1 Tax=Prolixibacter sp. SD074 TaxID=2652391 RepID=UPI001288BC86|nr:RNA polymerase sigma-70 factor [Prolixibacter sp. SD074]GET28983.1 DNA-directed RNA polymerase sigma-70 factor [Prolixibacter sp. SD074]